ncbi:MAG: succinate dehydrogenase, cytochrome b556 subunit [Anaerolineae bacterium]|nr:succinate dehydrogenase, cytochrome b556 subunit [Anaerolineae bacterium]
MATIVTTVTEVLRYRGKIGQWSWVFHRVSGLGIVLFVCLHVVDTSWAAFYPDLYKQAIAEYQSPLFTIGEFFLVAAVVYHAINGYRIIVLDRRPHLWHLQQRAAVLVFVVVGIILIPVFVLMFGHVLDYYDTDPEFVSIAEIAETQAQFAIGFVVIVGAALILSFLQAIINGEKLSDPIPGTRRASQLDIWFWKFMRVSGLLILPLVFGHLAMMHVIMGVFDITAAGGDVIGTDLVNQSGSAVEFVGDRWNFLVAGVAVWRLYDGALLGLIVLHGFYGLRLVVNDYAHNRVVNRALNWAIVFGAAGLILVGSAALFAGVENTAEALLQNIVARS